MKNKSLKEILGFDMNFSYSTMRPNGLRQMVEYRGNRVVWGLNIKGYPPTLIYPRPNIWLEVRTNEGVEYRYEADDGLMMRCIQNEKPEDIIKAMFNKEIIFKYYENN